MRKLGQAKVAYMQSYTVAGNVARLVFALRPSSLLAAV